MMQQPFSEGRKKRSISSFSDNFHIIHINIFQTDQLYQAHVMQTETKCNQNGELFAPPLSFSYDYD